KAFHFWLFSEPFTLAVRGSFPLRQAQGPFAPHHEVKGGSARSNPHPEVRAKRALKDEGAWISQSGLFPVARGKRPQAQRIELDEACGVLLVVSALIVLEGDELVGIERLRRLAADHHHIALVELERDFAFDMALAVIDCGLQHFAFRREPEA